MFRKLLLTSLGRALASGDTPYSQLLIKIAVSFLFLCIFIRHSPFAADEVDIIVVATQTCTLLTLMYALCIRIGFFESEGITPEAMAAGMMVIQTAPVVVAIIIIGWLIRRQHARCPSVTAHPTPLQHTVLTLDLPRACSQPLWRHCRREDPQVAADDQVVEQATYPQAVVQIDGHPLPRCDQANDILNLLFYPFRICSGKIGLIKNRNNFMIVFNGLINIRKGLGFDTLASIYN